MTVVHAAIQAFIAIACGAFGAHGLKGVLGVYELGIWQTASTYQLCHALALFGLGVFEMRAGRQKIVHVCFGLGCVLFSGSLYLLALTGASWLGAITPLGGISFLLGWALLGRAGWKIRKAE